MLQGNGLSADVLKVKMIEIDENGEVMTRLPKTDYDGQLNRTLLLALYPDIKVVQIQVPQMLLDRFEERQVASRPASVSIDGAKYCLAGGTGSVKNGVFYAVDAKHKDVIAKRFQNWPLRFESLSGRAAGKTGAYPAAAGRGGDQSFCVGRRPALQL